MPHEGGALQEPRFREALSSCLQTRDRRGAGGFEKACLGLPEGDLENFHFHQRWRVNPWERGVAL